MRESIDIPPPAIRRYGDELLELLSQYGEMPDEALPEVLGKPLEVGQRNQIKVPKNTVKEIAEEKSMSPEILLSGKDYEMLVREARGESIEPPLGWSGWREGLVIRPLRQRLLELAS